MVDSCATAHATVHYCSTPLQNTLQHTHNSSKYDVLPLSSSSHLQRRLHGVDRHQKHAPRRRRRRRRHGLDGAGEVLRVGARVQDREHAGVRRGVPKSRQGTLQEAGPDAAVEAAYAALAVQRLEGVREGTPVAVPEEVIT